MKAGIISILLAILALIFCLPVLAEDGGAGEVTITMNTESLIAIELSQTNWVLGIVNSNEEHKTNYTATWCTITNTGNANVEIYIQGNDAQCVDAPNDYKWTLSNNGQNGKNVYALWYHIAKDTADSYTLITKEKTPMKHVKVDSELNGTPLTLRAHDDTAQFGLKLLTPTYFYANREMETQITISAVAA